MRLLTVAEVAEQLAISADQVRTLIASGRLRAVNLGTGLRRTCWRISPEAVGDMLAARGASPQPKARRKATRLPPVRDYFPHLAG